VSLGLIRMANIAPLFDVALAMYALGAPAPGVRVHLCVYHSQFPLLLRSAIERQLDNLLNRRGAQDGHDPALQRPALRACIDAHPEHHHLFIVLGSPVTEVGRDHDYDWAVVEPSSMRSLIQLAGRVRRHRPGAVDGVNMAVLDSNLRHYHEKPNQPAYCRPGFETAHAPFLLKSHHLRDLLARETGEAPAWAVDARPRIALPPDTLRPSRRWTDLEHARMHDSLLPKPQGTSPPTPRACTGTSPCLKHPGHYGSPACCHRSSAFATTRNGVTTWPCFPTRKKKRCGCTGCKTETGGATNSMCRCTKASATRCPKHDWHPPACHPGRRWT
jgi:CRISPR-associated endonuclease/helicase Cas3